MAKKVDNAVQTLLDLIDEAYDQTAWHGPNLKFALRGVTAEAAAWTPNKGRHSIREIVLHAAFWKNQVRHRFLRSSHRDFPFRGRNWFAVDDGGGEWSEKSWRPLRNLLHEQHRLLRQAVAGLSARQLTAPAGPKGQSVTDNVVGIALHDVYHAGQIQLLKRLMQSR
jgi:DinB superfamily